MNNKRIKKAKTSTCIGLTKPKFCKCKIKLGPGSSGGTCHISESLGPKPLCFDYTKLQSPIKSEADKNEYLVIQLKNGLKAVLVKDNSEDEKTAAIAVGINVGYFHDPLHVQGLAHFLEHMVFMGSEKYPVENEFDVFISSKGGSFNALTGSEDTIFYFDVANEHMYQGMDMLSQFFISPLLNYDSMSREREAVESEYQLSITEDFRRQTQILMNLGSKDNPCRKFDCGNLETLKVNIDDKRLYRELHAFRKLHYTADKMVLALQTKYDLDTMASWVYHTFSKVKVNLSEDGKLPILRDPFPLDTFHKIYFVESLEDFFQVSLTWSLPLLHNEYKKKPLAYLESLLHNNGEGSLRNWLKKQHWGISVVANTDRKSVYTLFTITLVLTEEGYHNYTKCIRAVFSFIKFLQDVGPLKHIWIDQKKMADLRFKFKTPEGPDSNVMNLVENLTCFPPQDILIANSLKFEFDPEYIRYFLNKLTPETVNIMVASKYVEKEYKLNQVEKWYKTKYTSIEILKELKETWNTYDRTYNFSLPETNPYVPDDFSLYPVSGINVKAVHPRKIKVTDKYELWFKQDNKFKRPEASLNFYFKTPTYEASNKIMLDLFVTLFKYITRKETDQATSAGIHYYVDYDTLSFDGYNQHLHVLIDKILDLLINFTKNVTKEEFETVKRYHESNSRNTLKDSSYLKSYLFSKVTREKSSFAMDQLKILPSVTFDDFIKFMAIHLETSYVYCLIEGNITEDIACSITEKVVGKLVKFPLKETKTFRMRKLQKGQANIKVKSFNNVDNNCITTAYFQDKPGTMRDLMILKILRKLLQEPLFHQLRTKEQLGYSVYSSMSVLSGILGLEVEVISQSNKTTVDYVENRILDALESQLSRLQNLSIDEFNDIVKSIVKEKSEKDTSPSSEFARHWNEIRSDEFIFDRNEKEIETLKSIKPKEVYLYFDRLIRSECKLLVLQIVSNEDNSTSEDFTKLTILPPQINKPGVNYVTDIEQYIDKLELYQPHKIIE